MLFIRLSPLLGQFTLFVRSSNILIICPTFPVCGSLRGAVSEDGKTPASFLDALA